MRPMILALLLVAVAGASPWASGQRPAEPRRLEGLWGGDKMRVTATAGEVEIQIECLRARSDEPIVLDAAGAFSVPLTFKAMRGVDLQDDDVHPVTTVRGRVQGDELRIEVGPPGVEGAGKYVVRKGQTATLPNCRLRG